MKESRKRQRTKVKDPITGQTSWEWRDKITIRYSEDEKLPIILEFLKGGMTAEEMTEKYHICSVQTLLARVCRYLTEEKETVNPHEHEPRDRLGFALLIRSEGLMRTEFSLLIRKKIIQLVKKWIQKSLVRIKSFDKRSGQRIIFSAD